MFSRVTYDSFQLLFPLIGFILFFGVFLGVVVKVALMKKNTVDHLSSLPFSEDPDQKNSNHERETR